MCCFPKSTLLLNTLSSFTQALSQNSWSSLWRRQPFIIIIPFRYSPCKMHNIFRTARILSIARPASAAPNAQQLIQSKSFSTTISRCHASPAPRLPRALPEFSLQDKVVVVSGGARGLGLVQIEALLEAGATGQFLQDF